MKYALINKNTNFVENIIILNDLLWPVPDDFIIVEITNAKPVTMGDRYVDGLFNSQQRKAEEEEEEVISIRRATARASGLAKLGLTDEEAEALGLGDF